MNAWSLTTYKGFAFAKSAYGPFKLRELLEKWTRLLSCVVIFPSPEWTRVTLLGTAASPDWSPSDWSGSQATKKDHLPGDTEWSSAQGGPEWGSSLRVNPSLADFREISGARRTLGTESLKKKEPSSKDEFHGEGRRGSEKEKLKTSSRFSDRPFVFWRAQSPNNLGHTEVLPSSNQCLKDLFSSYIFAPAWVVISLHTHRFPPVLTWW